MPSPLRVLHLEDSPRDAEVVRHRMEAGGVSCNILLVNSKDSFEAALTQEPFDLILSDYNLPGYDGVAALKHAQFVQPDVPVIIISGTVGEEEGVRCLHLGATDYLLKGNLDRLAPAVERAIQEAETGRIRKRAEAALVDLQDAINQHAIVAVMDPRGTITFANDKLCKVSGLSRDELVGQHDRFVNSGQHSEAFMRDLWTTIQGGNVWHGEIKNKAKDGTFHWLDTTIVPFLSDDGTPRQYMAIQAVITERKEAEIALAESEARYRALVEWSPEALIVSRGGKMLFVNPSAIKLLGATCAQDLVGKPILDMVHPDIQAAVRERIRTHAEAGSTLPMLEARMFKLDGTAIDVEIEGRSIPYEGESALFSSIRDITERRVLEQQFQQAQKMEAVGQLAGGVAHDFNNLLTVILGFCELLLADQDAGDPRHADISEIQKAGMRAAGLTRQLLAFSRKEIIEPTRLDLNVIVGDMQVMLRRLIREDVQVVLSLQPELAPINADRGQVEQIVMNLAVNARDAMPNGGTLTIETANVELDEHYARTHLAVNPGPYVALTVADTGTGMTPQVQARLFEPFFTTKEPGKGTGLGMATVYGIITRSGGSVGVDSEVGRGTSFKVYFPRAVGAETVVDAPAPPARPSAGTQTVLLVDDEEGLRELAKRLLLRQGYTVLVARGAEEAIRLFDENPSIDVLLTDVVMPGASGPELVDQLVARRPGLKVIYMSGYSDEAIAHHGVLNPGIAFLSKPFTSDTLGRRIREVLGR